MGVRHTHTGTHVGRRGFIVGTAGALAGAALARPFAPSLASAAGSEGDGGAVLPAPKPIPGGDVFPPLLHVYEPGPLNKTLPYTGAVMEGLDVEPSTITDFTGVIAQAYHVGTAIGSDGKRYSLETDIRAFQGQYIAVDGSRHTGTFAFL